MEDWKTITFEWRNKEGNCCRMVDSRIRSSSWKWQEMILNNWDQRATIKEVNFRGDTIVNFFEAHDRYELWRFPLFGVQYDFKNCQVLKRIM